MLFKSNFHEKQKEDRKINITVNDYKLSQRIQDGKKRKCFDKQGKLYPAMFKMCLLNKDSWLP